MAAATSSYNQRMPPASGSFQEPRRLELTGPVQGTLRVPASKSLAQRVLLAAAVARGRTEISGLPAGLPAGADVQACLGVVRSLGARVQLGNPCQVEGAGLALKASVQFNVGESGTLARLTTALLALNTPLSETLISAEGSLAGRHSGPLLECLRAAGAALRSGPVGSWPLGIQGVKAPPGLELQSPLSSQEVSALWLACAIDGDPHAVQVHGVIPSEPYLGLTEQVLVKFGVTLNHVRPGEAELITHVRGPLISPGVLHIEADASSAAVALAAACLSGGSLRIPGIPADSVQGDVAIVDYLLQFGCEAGRDGDQLWAHGFPRRAAHIDLSAQPDLAPVLAIIAAAAAERSGESSVLTGLGTLPGKESDRLGVLEQGLCQAGWRVEAHGDRLCIGAPCAATPAGLVLDSHGDHRMGFAFALLGILRPGLLVGNPGAVAKSWPSFWEDTESSS